MRVCDICKKPIQIGEFYSFHFQDGRKCYNCCPFVNEDVIYELVEGDRGAMYLRNFEELEHTERIKRFNDFIVDRERIRSDEILASLDGLLIPPLVQIVTKY